MTTEKQAAANKANAQKSTGPKTDAGKQVVAMNAITHGILSRRLLLTGEDPADYQSLLTDLRKALRPAGALELALVEKIAVALWKQRRLVTAETAAIELTRSMRREGNRGAIKSAMGLNYMDADITEKDLEPMPEDEIELVEWCKGIVREFKAIPDEVLTETDLATLKAEAPMLYAQLVDDAESDGKDLATYIKTYKDDEGETGLAAWAWGTEQWCEGMIQKHSRKPLVQSIAKLITAEKSAPIANELMMRYQIAIDGELYRAMEALRKQQAFRLKLGIEIDGEAEVVS